MLLRRATQGHSRRRCAHTARAPPTAPPDTRAGQFRAEELNPQSKTYSPDNGLALLITADETFDNDHRVVSQKASNKGRFTFSAQDAGVHRICLWASHQSTTSWFSSNPLAIRVHLDLAIGETSAIESRDKDKISDIVQRVKDLGNRLQEIRREQEFQRVSFPTPGRRRVRSAKGHRNARPSLETRARAQTQRWSGGC